MYVDSRKMVQINLFTRQEWGWKMQRTDCGHGDWDELGDLG